MERGDFVWTWFNSGGKQGAVMLFGKVIASGPKAVRVLWESGFTNRVRRDDPKGVTACGREKLDDKALAALEAARV